MDWKLELVVIPVTDVDRAKRFYSEQVGFVVDHDTRIGDDMRVVQLTPAGSACSIAIGNGLPSSTPGSVQGIQLVVSDIDAARAQLLQRGVEVSPVQHFDGSCPGRWTRRRLELVHLFQRSRRQRLGGAGAPRAELKVHERLMRNRNWRYIDDRARTHRSHQSRPLRIL